MMFLENAFRRFGLLTSISCAFALFALLVVGCKQQKAPDSSQQRQEDLKAKQMLQGIWVNPDEANVAFRAKGDTIYYPDSMSMPVAFQVFGDTLVLHGAQDVRYAIVRQAPHLFEFRNLNGDNVKLMKSDEPEDMLEFENTSPRPINQNRLIRRDTVLMVQSQRYHCYVQVNPTTYKVIKTTYNDEGVSVDNIYFDNIINLAVFRGAQRLFSSDFHKTDFSKHVPADVLKECILSDMTFNRVGEDGIHYDAEICIPDSPSSYVVDVLVAFDGKVSFHTNK